MSQKIRTEHRRLQDAADILRRRLPAYRRRPGLRPRIDPSREIIRRIDRITAWHLAPQFILQGWPVLPGMEHGLGIPLDL